MDARAIEQLRWLFLVGVTFGTATWSAHLIAMLGYRTSVPATFGPVLTVISLLIPVLGNVAGS
jgi:diguanylate cyclase